jgi:hypothetical protein
MYTATKKLPIDIYSRFGHNAKTWKQPRYPSGDEWINRLVHPDNETLFGAKTKWLIKQWKETKECGLLSERSQSEKPTCCTIPTLHDILEQAKLWSQ